VANGRGNGCGWGVGDCELVGWFLRVKVTQVRDTGEGLGAGGDEVGRGEWRSGSGGRCGGLAGASRHT